MECGFGNARPHGLRPRPYPEATICNQHTAQTPRRPRLSAGSVLFRLLTAIAALALCVVAFYGTRGYSMYKEALGTTGIPAMAEQIKETPGFTTVEELPRRYVDAVIAVEDHRFYRHPGFDIIATGRALANDLRAGAFVEGGSTITQQLAKNQFFTQDRKIERKAAEAFMAFDLESKLSKNEILELYVNSIYFGNGYYGISAASIGYFGKTPSELTDSEATLLAGVPNAPSAYAPTESPELAQERQLQVLRRMVECEMLTSQESQEIAQAA